MEYYDGQRCYRHPWNYPKEEEVGYRFRVKDAVRVKVTKEYPWPAPKANPPLLDRTIKLFGADTDYADVLTKQSDGRYMKHTGICCINIPIPDEDVEPWPEDPVELEML